MNTRRFPFCTLLLLSVFASLAGCDGLSEYWHSPSAFTQPPPRPEVKYERRGGFTVLVDGPSQPSATRVLADIRTFAEGHGFARSGGSQAPDTGAPERYISGGVMLDVSYQGANFRVVAALHSFSLKLSRKFAHQFVQEFRQQYGAGYGDEATVLESDWTDDAAVPVSGGGGRVGGVGGRGGRR